MPRMPAASVVENTLELETGCARFARIDDHGQSMQNIRVSGPTPEQMFRCHYGGTGGNFSKEKILLRMWMGTQQRSISVFWLLVWGDHNAVTFAKEYLIMKSSCWKNWIKCFQSYFGCVAKVFVPKTRYIVCFDPVF